MSEVKISLSYPDGAGGRRVAISINNEISGAALRVDMELAEFALLLSALQFRPCEIKEAKWLDKWDKRIDRKTVVLPRMDTAGRSGVELLRVIEENTPEGYEWTGHSHTQRGFEIHYARWVEIA